MTQNLSELKFMNHRAKLSLLLLFIFLPVLLANCSGDQILETTETTFPEELGSTPTVELTPSIEISATPTPQETQFQDPVSGDPILSDYQINVTFNYSSQTAQISQTIHFTNNSSEPLTTILLACDPLRYPGSFLLESAVINSESDILLEEKNFFYSINLPEPLQPGELIEIKLDYLLQVPPLPPPSDDRKPGIFGYSSVQSNLVDWYPFIPPLSESGEWILHDPWFYGEYLVYDIANFDIWIEIIDAPAGTTIAASTLPIDQNDNNYYFSSKRARNFVLSMSPSYISEYKEINGITISTHTFPFDQLAGKHVLEEVSKAIELYSDLFSPYPRENLTIVEGDFFDGMEYDGLFFLGRGYFNLFDYSPQNYLTFIAVHEAAHQWWYSSVANDQALEPWLDEALCTYSELLFYENYYPDLVNWWWEYRVNFYQPDGHINKSIYEFQGFIPYRNATYLQGAKFLQSLRNDIGDQAFFDILKEYAISQQDKISSEAIFFQIVKDFSGVDPLENYPEFLIHLQE